MTWSSYSSIQNYEFTAFAESALLMAGDHSLSCGDKFVMPDAASVCIAVKDNDKYLSGDSSCNENADDWSYQTAKIMDAHGAEVGNGKQIYAESYHWVSDQHGNWYVLIEIEQEGTGDDYFAFYTGGCYTVPPAGAHLTVHGSCNVKGDWLKFEDLDSGPKPEPEPATGSICGSVFCDTNCDGVDGIDTIEPGCDYVIEAEHMWESGFTTFHGSQASGGQGVKLNCAGDDGWLKTTFNGKTGVYDVTIRVQDENDGRSVITLLVDGRYVEAVRLDRDSDGSGSDNGGFSHYVIRDVAINEHSEIKLVVDGEHGEFVRIDNLTFEGQDKVVRTPEPPKEGVTVFLLNADGTNVLDANGQPVQTVTDAEGMYEFTNVPVGDYRVKFVAPDGTVFTSQNQGDDDTRDSDVNDAGVSDVFTVNKDEKTKDIDAGVKDAPTGSISGRYFCDENDNDVDDGEPGIAGVRVLLLDADGNPTGAETTTADDGSYSFGDLTAGIYGVRFVDTVSGKTLVAPNVGADDAIDSDAIDEGNGVSVIRGIVVVAGQDTPDNDAGVEELPGSISGRYFCDENDNDVDDGEPGIAGVRVLLLDADGNPIGAETTTADDGSYSFGDLRAGTYGVRFVDTVSGKTLVAPNVGNDDAVDSDAIDLGNGVSVIRGIVVVAGQDTPDNDAGVEVVNEAPAPMDDMGKVCANELLTLDVLDNDMDADGDPLSIVAVDGQAFDANGQVTLANGVVVSLVNGELVIDGLGSQELVDLEIGESLTVGFTYTVSDGVDSGSCPGAGGNSRAAFSEHCDFGLIKRPGQGRRAVWAGKASPIRRPCAW